MNALSEFGTRLGRRGHARFASCTYAVHHPVRSSDAKLDMPGPQNTKRKKKQQAAKEKVKAKKTILAEVQQNVAQQPTSPAIDYENQDEIVYLASRRASVENKIDPKRRHSNSRSQSRENILLDSTGYSKNLHDTTARSPELWVAEPFITDPGNGPRVKDMRAYLSSFFCPPVTYDDPQCSAFAREEVLGLLEAVLPHEVALVCTRFFFSNPCCMLTSAHRYSGTTRRAGTLARVRHVNDSTA